MFLFYFSSYLNFFFQTTFIHEGHNLVIINKNSSMFYKNNFPSEIYNFFNKQFKIHYNKECDQSRTGYCWKNFKPNLVDDRSGQTNNIFATSSDWSFKKN